MKKPLKEIFINNVKRAYVNFDTNQTSQNADAVLLAEKEAVDSGLFDEELAFIPENIRSMHKLITDGPKHWENYYNNQQELNKKFKENPSIDNLLDALGIKKELNKANEKSKRKALADSNLVEVRVWVLPSEVNEIKIKDRQKEVWNKTPGRKKKDKPESGYCEHCGNPQSFEICGECYTDEFEELMKTKKISKNK